MTRTSIKAAVRDATRQDKRERKDLHTGTQLGAATDDSFANFAQKFGIGAQNALSTATYGYNPITRNRTLLEWIHRGSWLGGVAIDLVGDDMTRAGVDFVTEMDPSDGEAIEAEVTRLGIWNQMNETIRWSRLYGGCVAVMLIDGQDLKTPLRLETVGKDQFKGLLVLDRWMLEPSLEDLVTDYGPYLGLPKYYRVQSNAPALKGQTIHYSRLALRLEGIQLPYQQRLTENLWGISVLERLYDRMIAFDSASTGAAQLVYKCYLRTLKIKGMREIASAGGPALNGLMQYTNLMRQYQGMEGITLLDADDEFDVQHTSAFSGLSDALNQFGQQLSGALQIPLVRLFGQSPAGLSSSGESDIRTYYDGIRQQQDKTMFTGVATVYKLVAQSKGIKLPPDFQLQFASLWDLTDLEKADAAGKTTTPIMAAYEGGILGRQTAMKELRQMGKKTGVFTNITAEAIEAADDEVGPPGLEGIDGLDDLMTSLPSTATKKPEAKPGAPAKLPGDVNARPQRKAPSVGGGKPRRALV